MNKKILIVEDEFIVADDLQMMLEQAGYSVCGIAESVEEARRIVKNTRPHLVLIDIHLKGPLNGIQFAWELKNEDIGFVYLSANSNKQIFDAAKATEPYGFLVKPYRESDVLNILDIAFYRQEHSLEARWKKEAFLQKALTVIADQENTASGRFVRMASALQRYIPFDFISGRYKTPDDQTGFISLLRTGFDEYQLIGFPELSVISGMKTRELQSVFFRDNPETRPCVYNEEEFIQYQQKVSSLVILSKSFDLHSEMIFPVLLSNGSIFFLGLFRRLPVGYDMEMLNSFTRLQQPLVAILDRIVQNIFQPSLSPKEMRSEKTGRPALSFEGIIGNSPLLLSALDLVTRVSPMDTSVLILGETGTGKEKIADAIHRLSPRAKHPLIKINCAALPPDLIESELFGHEKGSFTGATEKKIGKFELADKGSIFLDEIGEMPLSLQVKLLRVLQEKEIDRIGGKHAIKVDVRVIAATNRNLEQEMAEGRFRLDLYYRLNVFPISIPSLRERQDDIIILANHFVQQFCKKFGKPVPEINEEMKAALEQYNWPGNIRELENIIEQAVILHNDGEPLQLRQPLPVNRLSPTGSSLPEPNAADASLEENERDHILKVLKKTNGRIRGAGGAAELLQIPPTTLHSKMKKLGINRIHQ